MRSLISVFFITLLTACVTPYQDYGNFEKHKPRSILILPPINGSIEVQASPSLLSVLSEPIAEKGYYVFPVAVVDQMLKDNGVNDPIAAHQIPADKLREVFDADAALYITIEDWGNKYHVLGSTSVVKFEAELRDLRTGSLLWHQTLEEKRSSQNTQGGVAGILIGAIVDQVASELGDQSRSLADKSSYRLIHDQQIGFLDGPLKVEE